MKNYVRKDGKIFFVAGSKHQLPVAEKEAEPQPKPKKNKKSK